MYRRPASVFWGATMRRRTSMGSPVRIDCCAISHAPVAVMTSFA
jgi:hypothetical protein